MLENNSVAACRAGAEVRPPLAAAAVVSVGMSAVVKTDNCSIVSFPCPISAFRSPKAVSATPAAPHSRTAWALIPPAASAALSATEHSRTMSRSFPAAETAPATTEAASSSTVSFTLFSPSVKSDSESASTPESSSGAVCSSAEVSRLERCCSVNSSAPAQSVQRSRAAHSVTARRIVRLIGPSPR